MKYKIKFRLGLFWRSKTIIGHRYDAETDKMILVLPNGKIREVPRWREREVELASDFIEAQKKHIEQQTGQNIPLNIN